MSISVPPDVARRLEQEPNVSRFFVDAARTRMRAEQLAAVLAEAGVVVTDEGLARARAARAAVEAQWPRERYDEVRARVQRVMAEEAGRASAA